MRKRNSLRTNIIIAIVLTMGLFAFALVGIMAYSIQYNTARILPETVHPPVQNTDDGSNDIAGYTYEDFMPAIRRGILTGVEITVVLLVVLTVLANLFVARLVTTPLKIITNYAKSLSQGVFEYGHSADLSKRKDEIGLLAGAFDSMSHLFKDIIKEIEMITRAVGSGNLDHRLDTAPDKGDFRRIALEVNNAFDLICSYLHAIPEAIALFNEKREMLFRNRAMDEFLIIHGLEAEDPGLLEQIAGGGADASPDTFVSADYGDSDDTLDPRAAEIFSLAVSSPEPFTADIALLGDYGPDNYSLRIQRVGTEGPGQNSLCVMLLLSDVTMLTQAKLDAEAASHAKSDFLSRVSHEIRTPMKAVIWMTQIAKTSIGMAAGTAADHATETEKIRGCLEQIEKSSTHLLGIINDILDFSKIETGKFSLDITDFSLTENLHLVMSMMVPNAKQRNIEIRLCIENLVNDCISSDSSRLNQVLLNLLSNAVKFSHDGGEVLLNVSETDREDDDSGCGTSTFRFDVIDHGIGISEEQASRLFISFEQAEGGMNRSYGGAGLGLASCKNLVEMMEGSIGLQSKPGEGSTFSFTIRCPACPVLEKKNETETGETDSAVYDFTGKRCLVVDDIDINREIAVELLSVTGLSLETAEDGEDALTQFKASPEGYFDIILMDMQMPVMDGCTATREIRALDRGDSKKIPVVAMTANVTEEDFRLAADSGMNAHLGKPIEMEAMLKMLQEQLSH